MQTKDGKTVGVHNVSVRRSHRDGNREWAQAHTLRATDLSPAALAGHEWYRFLAKNAGTDRSDGEG